MGTQLCTTPTSSSVRLRPRLTLLSSTTTTTMPPLTPPASTTDTPATPPASTTLTTQSTATTTTATTTCTKCSFIPKKHKMCAVELPIQETQTKNKNLQKN